MGRTGAHFFLTDGEPPLLARMASDDPVSGTPFLSALGAFATRTLYANSSGDHLVGWAGSSLRHPRDLPDLTGVAPGRGVVRDDGRDAAFGGGGGGGRDATTVGTGGSLTAKTVDPATAAAADAAQASSSPHTVQALDALAALGWRRVDVCFRGTWLPFTAHNQIQVTRPFNVGGLDHVERMAREMVEVDRELLRRREKEG